MFQVSSILEALIKSPQASNISHQELSSDFSEFDRLYSLNFWYELSINIFAFFNKYQSPLLPLLFTEFCQVWFAKMNPLVYTKLAILAARQCENDSESLLLMEKARQSLSTPNFLQKSSNKGKAILTLVDMETANYKLRQGNLKECKELIRLHAADINSLSSIDPIVPSTYYRVCADYDKVNLDFTLFYRNSLLYLSCVGVCEDYSAIPDALERAHDICVAALLAENIYNFGEVMVHPIMKHLVGTEYEFLLKSLVVFNEGGDHDTFYANILPKLQAHPTLANRTDFLKEKFTLMSLVECLFVFMKEAVRDCPFSYIAQKLSISEDQIEFALLKALSLRIIKGTINEPSQIFKIQWIQPRILSKDQINDLSDGIAHWCQKVEDTGKMLGELVPSSLMAVTHHQ